MILYSYRGEHPLSYLPPNLSGKTSDEIRDLGWTEVTIPDIDISIPRNAKVPNYEFFTYKKGYVWNEDNSSYDQVDLTNDEKLELVNFKYFWELLTIGLYDESTDGPVLNSLYEKIRNHAKTNLSSNLLLTELICQITTAKIDRISLNVSQMQTTINELLSVIPIDADDHAFLQSIFSKSGMDAIVTLPAL
ncbi:hypothetical protein CMO86_09250 [Candidatus Woesearchaeota archaeon]|nr:hypothetical protein [Candidatus Woesearchaeota archaeon]